MSTFRYRFSGVLLILSMAMPAASLKADITTYDVPGAPSTAITYMSGGMTLGTYTGADIAGTHAFQLQSGTLSTIDMNNAISTTPKTFAGAPLGFYTTSGGVTHGFVRFNSIQQTNIDYPGATSSTCTAFLTTTDEAGSYTDALNKSHGWVFDGSTYYSWDIAGAANTFIEGGGDTYIWGRYDTHGFWMNLSRTAGHPPPMGGITVDYPGAATTTVHGLLGNTVVGDFLDGSGHYHGFVETGASFTPFDVSGALETQILGMTNTVNGLVIYGRYDAHGFYATLPVPEPATACMLGFAVASLMVRRRHITDQRA